MPEKTASPPSHVTAPPDEMDLTGSVAGEEDPGAGIDMDDQTPPVPPPPDAPSQVPQPKD